MLTYAYQSHWFKTNRQWALRHKFRTHLDDSHEHISRISHLRSNLHILGGNRHKQRNVHNHLYFSSGAYPCKHSSAVHQESSLSNPHILHRKLHMNRFLHRKRLHPQSRDHTVSMSHTGVDQAFHHECQQKPRFDCPIPLEHMKYSQRIVDRNRRNILTRSWSLLCNNTRKVYLVFVTTLLPHCTHIRLNLGL